MFVHALVVGEISIHALRGEGDYRRSTPRSLASFISIHALRGEGDCSHPGTDPDRAEFQSTPSEGRATSPS